VTNDPELVRRASASAESVLGDGAVVTASSIIPAFSEDFGFFQERVPGVMFFLGVSNPEKGWIGMPHSPNYVADEEAIFTGASAMAAILLDFLQASETTADLLLVNGMVYDGTGSEPSIRDIAITGNRITFVGEADDAGVGARQTLDLEGLMVTPGFIDMHSHAVLHLEYAKEALPFVYQGITTTLIGIDGAGTPDVSKMFSDFLDKGIGLNAVTYVGHGAVRRAVMGVEDRAPTSEDMKEMKALVRKGMEEGAFGLSTGLFYIPGRYAETEEVIELAKVTAPYGAIYDTHDRDLGATYKGIGYLSSIREAIRIGEESGTRVIFSHFNAQGAHNYGRAPEGARLVDEARARGVNVAAAQHVYTATQSSLRAYTMPRWASAGGQEAMVARFNQSEVIEKLDIQTMEMLAIRGGPEKLLFADPRPELNGRTLAQVASAWNIPVPRAVRRILTEGNAAVMNLDLYDIENTRFLAKQDWMMTCTDGRHPSPDQNVTHPRVYGAFTRKIRQFVIEENLISMPFAVRSMSGLAADFLELSDRGYIREGMYADIAVFDRNEIKDLADYQDAHHYSEGTVHVLVNGTFALKDGRHTDALAGVPILRGGKIYEKNDRIPN
jgi:N-acyl-D-amino-acid deacylase